MTWANFASTLFPAEFLIPTTCIIGTGTVVNPLVLLEELQELETRH